MTTVNQIHRATQIRIALDLLGERNGHHDFEQICHHLTSKFIAPNVRISTGPVSAGGDQGRDGESYWSETFSPDGDLAFCCTIQKNDLPKKVRSDVTKACTTGRPVQRVIFFTAQGMAIATQHQLQQWARSAHGVDLQIWDGPHIADQLAGSRAMDDVVESYLKIASESGVRRFLKSPTVRALLLLLLLLLAAVIVRHQLPRHYSLVYEKRRLTAVAGQCASDWRTKNTATRSTVDADRAAVTLATGPTGVGTSSDARDLAFYDNCDEGILRMIFYLGMATVPREPSTPQECDEAAPSDRKSKVVEPRSGLWLCTRTDDDALALVEIRTVTFDPRSSGFQADLWLTLWR
ncbi:hypothetical protein [Micromonospora antibiotica]|uniref:Restriction endonuclease type IV Mrr domain-containing protein n=1 Tax=Micromonospora antibiotica TaxID=2807623 RepID=A0ABS3V2A6_9ACTN|nr:hypothetical protein [Micromonospora antibiotica]MBO4159746.1 hypothetical protein [Micromonospora antibiotica]